MFFPFGSGDYRYQLSLGDGLLRMIGATDATIQGQFVSFLLCAFYLAKSKTFRLQSIGRAQAAAPLAVLRDLLLIVFSIIVPMFFGVTGIFWAAPIADVFAMAVTAGVMMRLWKELQEEKGHSVSVEEGHIKPSRPGVIVTISREHGSAGKRVGQLLARKMDIPCYYKEVTALAAQESGLAAEFISDINKNSPEMIFEYLKKKGY